MPFPNLLFAIMILPIWGCALPVMVFSSPDVTGLNPKNPGAFVQSGDIPAAIEVESLQPKLEWESFLEHHERKLSDDIDKEKVDAVTYDLKIWEPQKGYPLAWLSGKRNMEPGELVYSRKSLSEPWHTLEKALKPKTYYLWTVRARFHYDGKGRTTEWGQQMVRFPLWYSYFGFQTPDPNSPDGDQQ